MLDDLEQHGQIKRVVVERQRPAIEADVLDIRPRIELPGHFDGFGGRIDRLDVTGPIGVDDGSIALVAAELQHVLVAGLIPELLVWPAVNQRQNVRL